MGSGFSQEGPGSVFTRWGNDVGRERRRDHRYAVLSEFRGKKLSSLGVPKLHRGTVNGKVQNLIAGANALQTLGMFVSSSPAKALVLFCYAWELIAGGGAADIYTENHLFFQGPSFCG